MATTNQACSQCAGSGEGMHDGTTCQRCRGRGIDPYCDEHEEPEEREYEAELELDTRGEQWQELKPESDE